jgi:hypothetical protein
VFKKSWITALIIPRTVDVLGSGCFASCKSLDLVVFEAGSRLRKIESKGFQKTAITEIVIPKCVVLIGVMCFAACQSLTAIAFEAESQLKRVESQAFAGTAIPSVILSETIQSLSADAFEWTAHFHYGGRGS